MKSVYFYVIKTNQVTEVSKSCQETTKPFENNCCSIFIITLLEDTDEADRTRRFSRSSMFQSKRDRRCKRQSVCNFQSGSCILVAPVPLCR